MDAFHYVAVSSLSGSQGGTQRTVGDAGPTSGRQVITAGKQKFTVIVIGKACYIKGNAAALSANLGLSATAATAHAGQWISLAVGDAPYASVYAAVTAASALTDNVTVEPETVIPTTTVDGRRVQTVSGPIAPITIGGTEGGPQGNGHPGRAGRRPPPPRPLHRAGHRGPGEDPVHRHLQPLGHPGAGLGPGGRRGLRLARRRAAVPTTSERDRPHLIRARPVGPGAGSASDQARRRYWRTAKGTKTISNPAHHNRAWKTGVAVGPPSMRARVAVTTTPMG